MDAAVSVGRQSMKKVKTKAKAKAKVKTPRRRLREDLKDPKFKAHYQEERQTLKQAIKIATEHISKAGK
jgi:hypothetical protein